MSLRWVVSPEAQQELAEACAWYELQENGLGLRLLEAFKSALKRIEEAPSAHPLVCRDARRIRLGRYPYVLFYSRSGDEFVVHAVFHCHRDPKRIWRVLSQRL